eukprot:9502792-Pyramimonas_sp.AAC.1
MERWSGKYAKVFFAWVAQRRTLREPVWVHENVIQFGSFQLLAMLGDLYVVVRVTINPHRQGWASHRERQYCIGVLKAWVYPLLVDAGVDPLTENLCDRVKAELDVEDTLRSLFQRSCAFSWTEYRVATPTEIHQQWMFLAGRKLVRDRTTARVDRQDDPWGDAETSVLSLLTPAERGRLALCSCSDTEAVDTNQNPARRKGFHSKNGVLHTLIANTGIVVSKRHNYVLHGKDLLQAMGFPISHSAVVASGGARCSFSHGVRSAKKRTNRSMRMQAGNAMHVSAIGAVHLFLALKFRELGRRPPVKKPRSKFAQAAFQLRQCGSA